MVEGDDEDGRHDGFDGVRAALGEVEAGTTPPNRSRPTVGPGEVRVRWRWT